MKTDTSAAWKVHPFSVVSYGSASLVGFTCFHEHDLAKKVTRKMINTPFRYIILHFEQPYSAWMISEKSFDAISGLKNFLRSVSIPEMPFARSQCPDGELFDPVNFLYTLDEEDCGRSRTADRSNTEMQQAVRAF